MEAKAIYIIPARGGSKRIPRKNIKNFCGKPMIYWAINNAIASNIARKVFVSTDDPYIADVSSSYGACVPFLRDESLADDHTPTIPVINDYIKRLQLAGEVFTHVCCLYPTTPLLTPSLLSLSFKKHLEEPANFKGFTFSACAYEHPIQRAFYINTNGLSKMYSPEYYSSRTQDLQESFYDSGQFYWASTSTWLNSNRMIDNGSPFIIPKSKVQDIDTEEDWNLAEEKFKMLKI